MLPDGPVVNPFCTCAFLGGATSAQIALDYDVLLLEDVYAVVNYYLHHRSEIDAYLTDAEADAARTRDETRRHQDLNGIRERLLARRSTAAE